MHRVHGVPAENGTVKMPCPTCGADMFAELGAPQVICGTCGTTYNTVVPERTHVDGSPKERVGESAKSDPKQNPEPEKPENDVSKYGFPVYENPVDTGEPEPSSADIAQTPRDDWGSGTHPEEHPTDTEVSAKKPKVIL
jgi:uncharacterized Zn finger protein (UPF0148 family)